MATVLVTGASGFTGQYMIETLRADGFKVVGLGHDGFCADETIPCDLTDSVTVRSVISRIRPDWVVHLAAVSFVGHANAEAFYRVNVFGSLNLLEALASLNSTPSRILVASSANVYGTPGIEHINEQICPVPVNHYACSKLVMEHMVSTWFERLPIVVTRPFNYTGPGQHERFLIPKIVSHFARGERMIELGNLDVSRDFSDVRDVVGAYTRLLRTDARGMCVNVCSGKAIALRNIIEIMNGIAGYEIEVRVNPAFVRTNEIPVLTGDDSRLRQLIGVRSLIPLEQTLRDMFEGMRNQLS